MECNKFIEEKIGETDSPVFRAHLVGCPGCARDVEELGEVRSLYREAATEKYRGGVPRLRRFRMNWVPMAAAAAVLLLVFGLIVAGPRENSTKESKPEKHSPIFVRVHLQPWGGDARLQNAFDDCWRHLEQLEKSR